MLCKYANTLGKPNKGLHSIRICNIAVVDLALTILLAFGVSKLFKINFGYTFIIIFIIAILLHYIFCVNTTVNKFLFGER